MSSGADEGDSREIAPDAAFAALGNETRIEILQTLAEADGPLSFSKLRDGVGLREGGQLNYHLGKLVGHFVRKTDAGYALSQSGRRVVEAVLSGVVTESPQLERTRIDWPCERCGAPIEVAYEQERVERYCTECPGTYGTPTRPDQSTESGYLGSLSLPPAGFAGRTPRELQEAAALWGQIEILTAFSGVCPSCSARVEYSLDVCEEHDATDGRCGRCDNRYAVWLHLWCPNCIYDLRSSLGGLLVATTPLLDFLTEHGHNPFSPSPRYPGVVWDFEEEVLNVDPPMARYTFSVEGDAISLTMNEALDVVDVTQ